MGWESHDELLKTLERLQSVLPNAPIGNTAANFVHENIIPSPISY